MDSRDSPVMASWWAATVAALKECIVYHWTTGACKRCGKFFRACLPTVYKRRSSSQGCLILIICFVSMLSKQATINKNNGATAFRLDNLSSTDLKRLIAIQQRELVAKTERLKGVEDLTRINHELEEKRNSWQTKAENYEAALQRAEYRIAVLNKKLGIGPQTAFKIDAVEPGVSRKDFDAITRENIKLKEALDHIVPTELGGEGVIVKNRELYELVLSLQEELAKCKEHIKELEVILNGNGEELPIKVNVLTKENMKLKRSMSAKQVFLENLMKENKRLKAVVEIPERNISEDITDGATGSRTETSEPIKVSEKSDVVRQELEKLKEVLEENIQILGQKEEEILKLQGEIEELLPRVSELSTKLAEASENQAKADAELTAMAKKCSDSQKKCQGFFKQVMGLTKMQQESEEAIGSLKRTIENLQMDLAERTSMVTMMQDNITDNQSDFKRERQEKEDIAKRLDAALKEKERITRENQSNTATIRHFETEMQRMNKLLNDERSRKNTGEGGGFQSIFGQGFGTAGGRSIFQDHLTEPRGITVADSGGGVNELDTGGGQSGTRPNPKPEPPQSSTPTLIECPYCSRNYPYHLIEGHVQDCMEDSLYIDD